MEEKVDTCIKGNVCINCRYWNDVTFIAGDDWRGECRRHSPTPFPRLIGGRQSPGIGFPLTKNIGWCGDFADKSTPQGGDFCIHTLDLYAGADSEGLYRIGCSERQERRTLDLREWNAGDMLCPRCHKPIAIRRAKP